MHTPDDSSTPTPAPELDDDTARLVDETIDRGAMVAASMFLALGPDTQDKVRQLRSRGWHLCFEIPLDRQGAAGAALTITSPSGRERKAISDLATDAPLQ